MNDPSPATRGPHTSVVDLPSQEPSTAAVQVAPAAACAELQKIGPYKIEKTLGAGAMGKVYLATHESLKRKVAVKTMLPNGTSNELRIERFKREMEAVGRLDHPNIVRATDAGEENGLQFIAMEFVDGIDVHEILQQVGNLSPGIACEIACQTAEGLQHIQEHGLVHRDLKPSNLIVCRSGQVKILDLGIARIRTDEQVGTLTADGGLMGTPDFIAPEQVLETGCVDIRADLYSLGCTLYRILGGRAPFDGPDYGTHVAKVLAHTQTEPENLLTVAPDTPPELAEFVHRLMAKSPDDRVQTPQEVIDTLASWSDADALHQVVLQSMGSEPVKRREPTATRSAASSPRQPKPRHSAETPTGRIKTTTAAAIVAILLAFTLLYFQPRLNQTKSLDSATVALPQDATAPVDTTNSVKAEVASPPESTTTMNVASVKRRSTSTEPVPPARPLQQPLQEIAAATSALEGSAQSIDATTQQMANTLEQIRDSMTLRAGKGATIENPSSIGEIYYNALTFTTQGKNVQARAAYLNLLDQDTPYVDVHQNFQRLLVVQDGIARARDTYSQVKISDARLRTLTQAMLLGRPEKRDALMDLARQHPDFAPAILELSHCVSQDENVAPTLAEQKHEEQLLTLFTKLHNQGKVLHHYLDKAAGARALEEVNSRLTELRSQAQTNEPVTAKFLYSEYAWQVYLRIPETCTDIQYSTDGTRYQSTERNIIQLPTSVSTDTLYVTYNDASDVKQGPFKIPFNPEREKLASIKRRLNATRFRLVRVQDGRIYFTTLYAYRKHLKRVTYGVNNERPDREHNWDENQGYYADVAEDVEFVTVQLTFVDDSVSEVVRIEP